MASSEKSLQGLRPIQDWYRGCKNMKELEEKLKKYCESEDPTRKDVLNRWKHLPKDVRECTARRNFYLMKIMILRAHGILPADFEGQYNNFFKGFKGSSN